MYLKKFHGNDATIRIGQEIQCLQYAFFCDENFSFVRRKRNKRITTLDKRSTVKCCAVHSSETQYSARPCSTVK